MGGTIPNTDIKKELQKMRRNAIRLHIKGDADHSIGGTRFGGVPDTPKDFCWPTFETSTFFDNEVKPRPLTFLAQFNCAELTSLDKEGLLPKEGLLSFFYEMGSQRAGYAPKDAGCARVFWFKDIEDLSPAVVPDALEEYYRFPMFHILAKSEDSLPGFEDFSLGRDGIAALWDEFDFEEKETDENVSKLLGWPDVIQNCMTVECELVSCGHYLGNGWDHIPRQDIQSAEQNSLNDWRLLLQLDTVTSDNEDFELTFGISGRIYFYIRKEDLVACNFDRVWLILQDS